MRNLTLSFILAAVCFLPSVNAQPPKTAQPPIAPQPKAAPQPGPAPQPGSAPKPGLAPKPGTAARPKTVPPTPSKPGTPPGTAPGLPARAAGSPLIADLLQKLDGSSAGTPEEREVIRAKLLEAQAYLKQMRQPTARNRRGLTNPTRVYHRPRSRWMIRPHSLGPVRPRVTQLKPVR